MTTECAQGRARYVMDEAYFPLKPWLHLDDDSPCLGPECRDQRSYSWDYRWDPSCGCLEHNVFACDLCPPEHRARGQVTDRREGERRKEKPTQADLDSLHWWCRTNGVEDRRISDRRKAKPSTGGQIIEQRERARDAEASAALAADSERDGTGSKREPGIAELCRAVAANVQAWAVGKPPDSLRTTVIFHLREAAVHIEGLEKERRGLSDVIRSWERTHEKKVTESQRLREALEQIIAFFDDRENLVQNFVAHGPRVLAPLERIAREALKETP